MSAKYQAMLAKEAEERRLKKLKRKEKAEMEAKLIQDEYNRQAQILEKEAEYRRKIYEDNQKKEYEKTQEILRQQELQNKLDNEKINQELLKMKDANEKREQEINMQRQKRELEYNQKIFIMNQEFQKKKGRVKSRISKKNKRIRPT